MKDDKASTAENQEADAKLGRAQDTLRRGYRGIIPVIPHGADLVPNSTVALKARGKSPGLRNGAGQWSGYGGWASAPVATEADARKWDGWGANVGCRMGGQIAALDVDVLDPVLSPLIEAKLRETLQAKGAPLPTKRVGLAPKFAFLFARETGDGIAKKLTGTSTKRWLPTDDKRIAPGQGIELLGLGKQAVLAGIHPVTEKPYQWFDGDGSDLGPLPPAVSALPVVPDALLVELYGLVLAMIEEAGYTDGPKAAAGDPHGAAEASPSAFGKKAVAEDRDDVAKVFSALPNDYGWDGWVRMGHALIGALGKDEASRELWTAFSQGCGAEDAQTTDVRWNGFPEQEGVTTGVGTILTEFDQAVSDRKIMDPAALDARARLRDRLQVRLGHQRQQELRLDLLESFVLPYFRGEGYEGNSRIKAEEWTKVQIEAEGAALGRLRALAPERYKELVSAWLASGVIDRDGLDGAKARADEERSERETDRDHDTVILGRKKAMSRALKRDKNSKVFKSFENCCTALAIGAGLGSFLRLSDQSGREVWAVPDGAVLPWPLGDRQPVWVLKGVSYFELTDDDALDARAWIDRQTVPKWSKADIWDALRYIAKQNRFRPVRDYLHALVWDGVPRIARLLPDYFGAEDTVRTQTIGERWMMGTANRGLKPGCKMDTALIAIGEQGENKSAAFETLAVVPAWFVESDLGPLGQKSSMESLQGKWIVELAELHSMRRSELNATKQFLSNTHDCFRAAYARRVETHPRMCSFSGTWNDDGSGLSNDVTGSRRFWTFEIGTIDLAALRRDLDQLWAEATQRARAGEKYWLDRKDAADAEVWEENEEVVDSMSTPGNVQTLLARYIKERPILVNGKISDWVPRPKPLTVIADVGTFWAAVGGDHLRVRPVEVGRAFKALKWHRIKLKRQVGPFARDQRVFVSPKCPKKLSFGQNLAGAQGGFIESALKEGTYATGRSADDFDPVEDIGPFEDTRTADDFTGSED